MVKNIWLILLFMLIVHPAEAKHNKTKYHKTKYHIIYDHNRFNYKPKADDLEHWTSNGWTVVEMKEGPDFCIMCYTYWDVTFSKVVEE